MAVVWVLVGTFAALIGMAALVDRRRYRGVQVPAGITGRERRNAVRVGRAQLAHLEMTRGSGHLGYTGYTGGTDAGGHGGGGGDGGCGGDGGSC